MKKYILILVAGFALQESMAAELFANGKALSFVKGASLDEGTTIGGYPIFQSDNSLKVDSVTSSLGGANGSAEAINRGFLTLKHFEPDGSWFATIGTIVNLSQTSQNQYFTGEPCGGTHLVASNKGAGKNDNCMTIDALSYQVGTTLKTYVRVKVTITKSGGRFYGITADLNPEMLGWRNTAPGDWDINIINSNLTSKAALERLRKWSEQLQNAVDKATDYSKPKNAFESINFSWSSCQSKPAPGSNLRPGAMSSWPAICAIG